MATIRPIVDNITVGLLDKMFESRKGKVLKGGHWSEAPKEVHVRVREHMSEASATF